MECVPVSSDAGQMEMGRERVRLEQQFAVGCRGTRQFNSKRPLNGQIVAPGSYASSSRMDQRKQRGLIGREVVQRPFRQRQYTNRKR